MYKQISFPQNRTKRVAILNTVVNRPVLQNMVSSLRI